MPLALPGLVVVVLAITAWPTGTFQPPPGLDYSWVIGLNLAFHQGLDYGRDLVFTYGPLGFLQVPVAVYPWPLRLSFVWLSAVQLAMAGTLLWSMRKGFGSWWIAVPLAILLMAILTPDPPLIIGFTGAVALIAGRPRTPHEVTLLAAALGVLAGVEILAKISVGVAITGVLVVAAATASYERRRAAIALGAGFVAAAGLGWFGTGQSLTAIPGYITGAMAISSGYASGMIAELPNGVWQLWAAGGIAVLGTVVVWRAGASLPLRSRAGLLLAWAVLWFVSFKYAFIRQDLGHPIVFATNTLGALTAFAWSVRRRDIALLVAAVPLMLYLGLSSVNPRQLLHPVARTEAYARQVALLGDGSRTNDEIGTAREAMIAATPLDEVMTRAISNRSVAIDPWDISVAFGYRMHWNPLPVIQSYTAYTKSLDDLNADRLADPERRPERILRHSLISIDSRNPVWESPAAIRSMLCHYRQITLAKEKQNWQVLGPTANRCGPAREVSRVESRLGQPVTVPPTLPGELLYVDIDGYQPAGLEKLRQLVYRAVTRSVALDGNPNPYQIDPETAGNGLLLRVPPSADYSPAIFALNLNPKTITLRRGAGEQSDKVTLRFMAVPINN
jgi:hypothetical protein